MRIGVNNLNINLEEIEIQNKQIFYYLGVTCRKLEQSQ